MEILRKIIKTVIGLACIGICALMLMWYLSSLGSTSEAAVSTLSAGIVEKYDVYANNANAITLDGIVPIKKVYKLGRLTRDQLVAPEPDQALFGESDDPAVIQAVIDSAVELMDGQTTVWNPDRELVPGTAVRYYCDDTILVLTWKEVINWSVYTFSEVKISSPTQIRRHIADNVFGSDIQYPPSEMAASVNAVVAINGDFYRFRNLGISVYDEEVYRYAGLSVDSCMIDENGDLHFVKRGEITEEDAAKQYVSDNKILFSVAFGPVLVENGENVAPKNYPLGEINDIYARAGIGQMDELHYLLATCNTEAQYRNAATVAQFAAEMHARGCKMAYTLDGGQSATIVMNDEVINSVEFGFQRSQSDIIYFATAIND